MHSVTCPGTESNVKNIKKMPFQDLPCEIIVEIIQFNIYSPSYLLLTFGLINKSMHQFIKSDYTIQLWKSILEKLNHNNFCCNYRYCGKPLKFKEGTLKFLNSDCRVERKSEKLIEILKHQTKFRTAKIIEYETRNL